MIMFMIVIMIMIDIYVLVHVWRCTETVISPTNGFCCGSKITGIFVEGIPLGNTVRHKYACKICRARRAIHISGTL